MTERVIDILPLILQLAQQKPIAQGLMIARPNKTYQQLPHANWPGEWHTVELDQLYALAFTQRYDLAVVNILNSNNQSSSNQKIDSSPLINQQTITQGLTRLRDLLARQVLVLADPQYSSLLHALGFSKIEQLSQNTIIWQFNILSYKQIPDWLNSKYWANPENWDKFRW